LLQSLARFLHVCEVARKGGIVQKKMLKKIAKLESLCDQLQSEMNDLDQMLIEIGFEDGVKTLKTAVLELIEQKNQL